MGDDSPAQPRCDWSQTEGGVIMTRHAIGAAAYVMPTFAIAIVWHLFVFADTYQALQVYRDDKIVPFGLAAMTIQGVIYAWVYGRLFAHLSVTRGALRFAAAAASLAWTYSVLAVAAKHPMTSVADYVAIETAFTAVQFAVASPLIALAMTNRRVQTA